MVVVSDRTTFLLSVTPVVVVSFVRPAGQVGLSTRGLENSGSRGEERESESGGEE